MSARDLGIILGLVFLLVSGAYLLVVLDRWHSHRRWREQQRRLRGERARWFWVT